MELAELVELAVMVVMGQMEAQHRSLPEMGFLG